MEFYSLKKLKSNKLLASIFLSLFFILLTYKKLSDYVKIDFYFIIIIASLPFVIQKQSNSKSLRYGGIAIVLLILYNFLHVNSLYFLSLVCTLFFIYEWYYGKLNSIPLFLTLIASPVAIFLSKIIGFEIRLWLTKIATNILYLFNNAYSYSGNIIYLGNDEFHVDSECMGLKMVFLAMYTTLIFISYLQQKQNKQYRLPYILIALVSSYFFVILSNLFRILLITLFKSAPNTISHNSIGVICFLIYVVIPLWFVVKLFPMSNKNKEPSKKSPYKFSNHIFACLILILSVLYLTLKDNQISKTDTTLNVAHILKNHTETNEEHGVKKLSNSNFLIYIKPAVKFYSADHSPIICWRGSGYNIVKEEIITIGNKNVFYTTLQQNNAILYSTWWYDSGKDKTISQYKWRKENLMHNQNFSLINVVSHSKTMLLQKTNELLSTNLFLD